MERNYIDLHVHSNASDGSMTPSEVVKLADDAGLYAFALTDHDCVNGLEESMSAAEHYEVKVIPGIEITASYHGEDAHILGLNIDYRNQALIDSCNHLQNVRNERNRKITNLMNANGFAIDADRFFEEHAHTSITRMHYARYLLEHGYVSDANEAFHKYLNPGGVLYVPREKIVPQDAIALIHAAGGHAVLAHPVLYKWSRCCLMDCLKELKAMGIEGIEAIYSRNTPVHEKTLKEAAKELGLFITGGSDFHGINKPDIQIGTGCGNLQIPKELLSFQFITA